MVTGTSNNHTVPIDQSFSTDDVLLASMMYHHKKGSSAPFLDHSLISLILVF